MLLLSFREKKLLVGSSDFGKDLVGVQNLHRKHRHLDNELANHEQQVQLVRSKGLELLRSSAVGVPEIQQRMEALDESWQEIVNLTGDRHKKLKESEEYQTFLGKIEEEEAWFHEKQQILNSPNYGENMAAVQGLLKKHEAFNVDLGIHEQRVAELQQQGQQVRNSWL